MITEHKESVGGQCKTETKETNGEARDEFRFMTFSCTNCTCKGQNRYQLDMGSYTTTRMTVFLKWRKKHPKKKSSKILFLKKKENQFSSNKKALKHFQLQVQTEWFVLQKQRNASVHCKRDTLYFQGIATGVMTGWHTNQIQQELLKTYIFHFHG